MNNEKKTRPVFVSAMIVTVLAIAVFVWTRLRETATPVNNRASVSATNQLASTSAEGQQTARKVRVVVHPRMGEK